MSPTQMQRLFTSSSPLYIMAQLIVGAKSFVTPLPLSPLSKDFTKMCKMTDI
jgi:hypothetical protein